METANLIVANSTPKHSHWYYMLNGKLVKEMKPCVEDNYIHIHRWNGCYRVYDATVVGFCIIRNREYVWLPWEEFRCLKGAGDSPEKYNKLLKRVTIHRIQNRITLLTKELKNLQGA